jgi:hypothetical protein
VREDLVRRISEPYQIRRRLTLAQIRDYIEEVSHLSVGKTTVFQMLRREVHVKSCHAIPMEEGRVGPAKEQIAESLASLTTAMPCLSAYEATTVNANDTRGTR